MFREGDRREAEQCLLWIPTVVELDLQLSLLAIMAILHSSFVVRKLDIGFGRAVRFLRVDLVETIDKRLILCIEITTNR